MVQSCSFNHGGEEAVKRMDAGNRSQIGSATERLDVLPAHFAGPPQLLQVGSDIGDSEFRRVIKRSFDDRFVFLTLQRTRGIDEPPANRKPGQRGLQDGHLPRLKIEQVFGFEPPLDLGVARQSACTGAGNVGQYARERAREWQVASVARILARGLRWASKEVLLPGAAQQSSIGESSPAESSIAESNVAGRTADPASKATSCEASS